VELGRDGIGVWPTQKLSRGAPYAPKLRGRGPRGGIPESPNVEIAVRLLGQEATYVARQ
jgi:hypothetical protein